MKERSEMTLEKEELLSPMA